MRLFQFFLFSSFFIATGLAKVHGPICQWYQSPTDSMAIHWIDENAEKLDDKYLLSYSEAGNKTWNNAEISFRNFGNTKSKVFSVDLKNLKANTRYAFTISSKEKNLGKWFFKTAPMKIENEITFVTGGDMFHTRELLDPMNLRAGTESPLFALLGGDLAYANGVDSKKWYDWVDSWSQLAKTPEGLMVPMVVVIGNHEVRGAAYKPNNAPPRSEAPYFYSLFFGLDEGSKFAIDFSDYMTIVALDSGHTDNVSNQTQWLEKTLADRKAYPFKFVCYHRPAWGTGVKEDAVEIQKFWSPIFEKHGVDAAFENDHHVYKRTYPLVAGKRDDNKGVVYIGDGSWGVRTRNIAADWREKRPFLAFAEANNHLIKVKLRKADLILEGIKADGVIFDSFTKKIPSHSEE